MSSKSHRQEFAKAQPLGFGGFALNEAHQGADGFLDRGTYKLAIIEFDDQGACFDREQMAKIRCVVDGLMTDGPDDASDPSKDAIFITFTHGWKHDGRTNDGNLKSFEALLEKTVQHEKALHDAAGLTTPPRPVYGIFVAWQGFTVYGLGIETSTFWNRQKAAHRVATGEPRELFGRLRHYRNHRLKHGGSPLLVIVGHSFGGLIVYSALEQSLIEAASAAETRIVPSFADLVLVVNAAFGAIRYLPIHTLANEPAIANRSIRQLPVFVAATARNDNATKLMYPIGNAFDWLFQATRGPLEPKCLLHTIGHVRQLETHTIAGPEDGKPFELSPPDVMRPNPFWVVRAEPAVINRHSGIFQKPFLDFAATLVFLHAAKSKGHGVKPGVSTRDDHGIVTRPADDDDASNIATGGLRAAAGGRTMAEIAFEISAL